MAARRRGTLRGADQDHLTHSKLEGVTLPEATRGFVLLPWCWVVQRDVAWASRFRRLVHDYERLSETVVGLHAVAFACLMAHRLRILVAQRA